MNFLFFAVSLAIIILKSTIYNFWKNKLMKKVTIGILAHVDAGKTTLSEGLLYQSGTLRKLGAVDKGTAYLDNDNLEKKR